MCQGVKCEGGACGGVTGCEGDGGNGYEGCTVVYCVCEVCEGSCEGNVCAWEEDHDCACCYKVTHSYVLYI